MVETFIHSTKKFTKVPNVVKPTNKKTLVYNFGDQCNKQPIVPPLSLSLSLCLIVHFPELCSGLVHLALKCYCPINHLLRICVVVILKFKPSCFRIFTQCLKKSAMWRHKNEGDEKWEKNLKKRWIIPHFCNITWLIFESIYAMQCKLFCKCWKLKV